MKKQVNVSLTYLLTFYPEDLGLDDTATRTALMDYTDVKIDGVIADINHFVGLMPNDIEVEVYEHRE